MIMFDDNPDNADNDDSGSSNYEPPKGFEVVADSEHLALLRNTQSDKPPRYFLATREKNTAPIAAMDSLRLGLWMMAKLQQSLNSLGENDTGL